jgi:hypothetical protein
MSKEKVSTWKVNANGKTTIEIGTHIDVAYRVDQRLGEIDERHIDIVEFPVTSLAITPPENGKGKPITRNKQSRRRRSR